MNSFLKWLAGNSLVRAKILAIARHIASSAAGAVALWLTAHGADQSASADISQAVLLALTGLASYGFSLWDKSNVCKKIVAAETTGVQAGQIIAGQAPSGQVQVDRDAAAKVATAIKNAEDVAPQTKVDALLRLRVGT